MPRFSFGCLRSDHMVTSFHHQPEAQHPKSSAIHKPPADYPIFWRTCRTSRRTRLISACGAQRDFQPDRLPRLNVCRFIHIAIAHPAMVERRGRMRRREFISMLGGALAAPATLWPQETRAQQPARVSRIGWIAVGTPQGSEFFEAFRQ